MIDANCWVKLVWRIVNRMHLRGENKSELFSAGCLGLLRASRLYNEHHHQHAKFSTYAWECISGEIRRHRLKERNYRACITGQSSRKQKIYVKRGTKRLILFSEFGSDYVRGTAPVFASVESDCSRFDDAEEQKRMVSNCLEQLTSREMSLIVMKFGMTGSECMTYRDIGQRFDISQERVRQIITRALWKMKCQLKNKP